MKAVRLAGLFVLGLTLPALAQQTTDPRIAGPMIAAMQAEIALRDAAIKAMQEDATKRDAQWAEYSKSLWEKPKEEAR
jgi:hypothetical protein